MPPRRVIPLVSAVLCTLLPLPAAPAHAQDAPALIRKMEAAYAGMKSYTHKMSSTWQTRINGNSQVGGITSELRYQQPNRAYIAVTTPQSGTIAVVSDGKQLTAYQSKLQVYTRAAAPPTMAALVQALSRYNVIAMLDPLYLLSGQKVERLATGFVMKLAQPVNGVKCSVLTSSLTPAGLAGAKSGRITYWVEPSTGLIRKLQIELFGVPTRIPSARKVKGKTEITITTTLSDRAIAETILDPRANPPLEPGAFTFSIPKGATEQNPEQFLKRK